MWYEVGVSWGGHPCPHGSVAVRRFPLGVPARRGRLLFSERKAMHRREAALVGWKTCKEKIARFSDFGTL